MQITEVTAAEVIAELPQLQDAEWTTTSRIDILLCASGFEERSIAVPEWLVANAARIPHTLVFSHATNENDNAALRPRLTEATAALGGQTHWLEPEIHSAEAAAALRAALTEFSDTGQVRVAIDISGASGRMILRMLHAVFTAAESRSIHLTVFYTQAETYAPTREEADARIKQQEDIQETGTDATLGLDFDAGDVFSVIERPGQHTDHAPDRAVVILGFNADRMRASLDRIDTAFNIDTPHRRVTYIAGVPPRPEDAWRFNAMVKINSTIDDPIDPKTASTLDYKETLNHLERIYDESRAAFKLTVLPFGSKMQTIAVGLFTETHPDVRVQMLAPSHYRGLEYSTGVHKIHQLELGDVDKLNGQLRSIGALVLADDDTLIPRMAGTDVLRRPQHRTNDGGE
ncbi:hypothetical protein ASE16_02040 [Leifsonia sp. Root227]|uniref:hypothetical protein n=1 Tax=Leifsonia sp. Root227 TaxID=1736496 RepID=UPI0006F49697|nr:hypothetical protein [Leifsonia sp. Root227]KRC51873.1 hypothetical protein ASE16_02040 [Leifsonia sp. Root227]